MHSTSIIFAAVHVYNTMQMGVQLSDSNIKLFLGPHMII